MNRTTASIIVIACTSALLIFYITDLITPPGNAINQFAIDFYKEVSKGKDNVFCSPFSFSTVLNMLLVGTGGKTAAEIRKTLHYLKGRSEEQSNGIYKELLVKKRETDTYNLKIGSAMWIQKSCKVMSSFETFVKEMYNGTARSVDFSNGSYATDQINDWANTQTNGKISQLYSTPLPAETSLLLANAIYFNASWIKEFDSLEENSFYNVHNGQITEVQIDFMYIRSSYFYSDSKELRSQVLELPYRGREISMFIILPHKRNGLGELEKKLSVENLLKTVKGIEEIMDIEIKIPKFTFSSTLNLNDNLNNMGIIEAFTNNANFSGVTCGNKLSVQEALQKTVIELSLDGTEAAAVSVLRFTPESSSFFYEPAEISFNANHPFFYFIFHKQLGVILFIGRVSKL